MIQRAFRCTLALAMSLGVLPLSSTAQSGGMSGSMGASMAAASYDSLAFSGLKWRAIGPYRGGRSVAA